MSDEWLRGSQAVVVMEIKSPEQVRKFGASGFIRRKQGGDNAWRYNRADCEAYAKLPTNGRGRRLTKGFDRSKPIALQTPTLVDDAAALADLGVTNPTKTVKDKRDKKFTKSKPIPPTGSTAAKTPSNKALFDWIEQGVESSLLSPAQAIAVLRNKFGG